MEVRPLPDSWRPEDPANPRWEDWHCVIDAVFVATVTALLVLMTIRALTP